MDAIDPQTGQPATSSASSGTTTTASTPAASGPNAAEERAKRKLAFLLRSSATIDKISLAKKGSGVQVVVPGVGTYVDGRNFFGQHEDKYFDSSGNKVSKQDFDRNVQNQMKVERKIMDMEKEKRMATMVSPSAPASPGTSTPMSAPTGTLSQQQAFKLIYDLKIPITKVAIELNKEIINKKEIKKIKLENNDVIEVVHFIGGG